MKCFAALLLGAVAISLMIGTTAVADETIAYWKFDSSNLTLDSSGNGYTLMTQGNVIADTDDYDGTGLDSQGSIAFDGISACAATLGTIDLSSYEAVRLSFYMKDNMSAVASAIEHTASYWGYGGFAIFPNSYSDNIGSTRLSTGANKFGAADPVNTQTGVWEQFTVEYWPTAPDMSDVIKVYKNGVFQEESTLDPSQVPTWDEQTRSSADTFANDFFYFGARALGTSYDTLYFNGKLDEVKLESFDPDPPLPPTRTEIGFPDVPGYQTLVCDFHMHTLYSDGQVMPEVRVEEAYRTGLDAIAIADHIEWRPYASGLPGASSHNTSSNLAIAAAEQYDEVIAIKGTEITRDVMNVPGEIYASRFDGHYLALFLDDADALDINADPTYASASEEQKIYAAAAEADSQGAFFVWAHHNWSDEANWVSESDNWSSLQDALMSNGWLHGLEIGNHGTYFPLAHQWCLDNGLTMLANSDIHAPDSRDANTSDDHRTTTLVFAEENTTASIQAALEAGRTAVWLNENIIGLQANIGPLFDETVSIEQVSISENEVQFEITNTGPVDLQLTRTGSLGPATLELAAGSVTTLIFAITGSEEELLLDYIVDNFLIAPETGMPVSLALTITPDRIAGDANGDGKVDGSDVTILAGNWQVGVDPSDTTVVSWAMGDFNGDGQVDGSDVTILAGNWQHGVTAASASVPEPSTLILLLCLAISSVFYRGVRSFFTQPL